MKKTYEIPQERFLELRYFCLQYNSWKKELFVITDAVIKSNGGMTQSLEAKRLELLEKINLVEKTAHEAREDLYPYILKAVTNRHITFPYLEAKGIPCGRTLFYEARRKFYYLLDKKKG